MAERQVFGRIGWVDLTVEDAPGIRAFYEQVLGWHAHPVSMGDYEDWAMMPAGGDEPVGGICHARGDNAYLPPAWLLYFTVDDFEASAETAERLGATPIGPVREMGEGAKFRAFRDPAGAVFALFQGPPDGQQQ